jgi:L-lysine 2,3-aminomutase
MLAKYHPLWMSVHVNHPRELTIEVKQALAFLPTQASRSEIKACCSPV